MSLGSHRPAAVAAVPAPANRPVVALAGVAKRFASGTLALDAFNLAVRGGEFVTLLGPSGCGKSTVLRLIAGLVEPSAGAISWSGTGHAPTLPSPACGGGWGGGGVGFVFQEPTLMPWATALRNVTLPLELSGLDRAAAEKHAAEVLERVGLGAFRDAYPRELSGGMRMRVSIARALVTDPPLLLMDEPFAALDEITRFKLNDDLLALWRAGHHTVVFVTHSVFESVYLSSRIVVMSARPGRVTAEIAVDAPHRDENFRTSPEYAGFCRIASQTLSRAIARDRTP
jgi:NitT/TauT family transport system ATP-binding protein